MAYKTSTKHKEQTTFSLYQWTVSPFISDAVFNEVSAANEQSLIRGFILKTRYLLALPVITISFLYCNTYADTVIPLRFAEPVKLALNDSSSTMEPSFAFNPTSNVMAIAESKQSADALAKKEREVYYLVAGQTVRQTIDRWAAINGYKVIYQTDVNFNVTQDTAVYGRFLEQGGALAQLLASLKNTSNPIKATVKSNRVLLIQTDEYSPSLLMPNKQEKTGD
jgi:hypothetical protein